MPILEQGYEPYRGPVRAGGFRAAPIAVAALRRNRRWYSWVLLALSLLFGSGKEYFFLFVVYVPAAFFGDAARETPAFFSAFANHPNLYSDMMATQTFWALVMAAVVGAGEIAEDLRTGALVFYLGRPLTRLDYVLGKTLAVSVPVLLVTLLPTLVLFTAQALFEGTWQWLGDHWRVVPAAAAYALLVCLFASGFVLGVSAVARRRRWATVAIAALLVGTWVVAGILAPPKEWTSRREQRRAREAVEKAVTPEEKAAAYRRFSDAVDPLGSGSDLAAWRALDPTATLAAAGRDLFGNPLPSNFPGIRHWVLAILVPGGLLLVLWRRVRAVEIVS